MSFGSKGGQNPNAGPSGNVPDILYSGVTSSPFGAAPDQLYSNAMNTPYGGMEQQPVPSSYGPNIYAPGQGPYGGLEGGGMAAVPDYSAQLAQFRVPSMGGSTAGLMASTDPSSFAQTVSKGGGYNAAAWDPVLDGIAAKTGVDPLLLKSIARQENVAAGNFNPLGISPGNKGPTHYGSMEEGAAGMEDYVQQHLPHFKAVKPGDPVSINQFAQWYSPPDAPNDPKGTNVTEGSGILAQYRQLSGQRLPVTAGAQSPQIPSMQSPTQALVQQQPQPQKPATQKQKPAEKKPPPKIAVGKLITPTFRSRPAELDFLRQTVSPLPYGESTAGTAATATSSEGE